MRRRRIPQAVRKVTIFIAAALLSGLAAPLIAAPTGQTPVDECRNNSPGDFERGCRSIEQVVRGFGAECRRRVPDPATCQTIDGRDIGPHQMAAYMASGIPQGLALQRRLDAPHPLWEQQIAHTHNSFNSATYDPTLTNQDPNQVYGLTDQLEMGIRFLELDLHWVPSIHGSPETGGYWVTLCHGNSGYVPNVHIGCSNDRPLQDGLAEIRTWLDANPDEFVYLYLENQIGADEGHDVAAQLLADAFPGPMISTPDTACADLPYDESRTNLQDTGARVLLVGNCGPGAWGGLVHQRGPAWNEGGDPTDYDASDCAADTAARLGHTSFQRYFGDSTWLTAMVSESSDFPAPTAAAMVECGVNIIGFDQLQPQDGKMAALLWSWTPEEALAPSGPCAAQTGAGRFAGRDCADSYAYACIDAAGEWTITAAEGPWSAGDAACAAEFPGSTFSVPWNGLRNSMLADAHGAHGADDVWLDYAEVGGEWTPEAAG